MLLASSVAAMAAPAIAAVARSKTATVVHTTKSSKYGTILVDSRGFTLYTYAKDTKSRSNCTGQCITIWPALVVPAGVTPVGKGVSGLGVAIRSNHQRQITYHNKPLYLFVSDKRAGEISGQGVNGFSVARLATTNVSTTTTTSGYKY
jgi:predicted lipoprotein with Yx(FWY)xxD motif